MSTGLGPYVGTDAQDTDNTNTGIAIETTLTATQQTVDIGGVMANVEVINGAIPAPTFRLNVGDTVVVRLVNLLPYPLGIHWHGVELENYSDGTEITQNPTNPEFASPPPPPAPAGGTFLYKFIVRRAGLFFYHPHHGSSINRVFRGLYGMIIVTDPLEANVQNLPSDTMQMVLSDILVCKAPGSNDTQTYPDPSQMSAADRPEWLSNTYPQLGPTPMMFCELPTAMNDAGTGPPAASYNAGDVPSLAMMTPGRMTEGQTVLTNGVNVGGRLGTPDAPGALAAGAAPRPVQSGQGLRLQMLNSCHLRYLRLRLTRDDAGHVGEQVNLVRVGGEGGLLDNVILEGGMMGTIDSRFAAGEILLPPAYRADVVAAIPPGIPAGSVLTLWTRDYQRAGDSNPGNWAQLPTVPVAHFIVSGAGATYTINPGDALRAPAGMPPVAQLGAANATLLNPSTFGKPGSSNSDIQFRTGGIPNIDGLVPLPPAFMDSIPYTAAPHIATSRYAVTGNLLELTVTNTSNGHAHHPFHLHGFSFQPVKIEPWAGANPPVSGSYTWPFNEFRDTIDLQPGYTFTFRVQILDRLLADGLTNGGAFGRWLFHCHIFFHHMQGMISEFVVTDPNGKEKPNVNVNGSWAYAATGANATRQGTFHHPDGLKMQLTASIGQIVPSTLSPGGNWSWQYTSSAQDPPFQYVYITATDTNNHVDQAVFRLQVGGADAGSDIGDPHIHTVDGKAYDFQAAGEFTLLRDQEGMEIQSRQTPAVTPPPAKDGYTGLTECVSLNSAVAARVGSHRISYQPWRERPRLQFFLDGKPTGLPKEGIDLDGHRVTVFAAGGETGIRIDYAYGPVVKITPLYWTSYGIWYLDVDVSNTQADQGLMARIPNGTWLPLLPSGATVGPMPAGLHERYVTLYKTFADAWRVTDQTSLFEYLPWTSTATFTDPNWPPQKPPCITVKPGFPTPAHPIRENIPMEQAKRICKGVTMKDLHDNCVFDVVTTGDETLAKGYLIAQELRQRGTAVQILGDKPKTRSGERLVVTATVIPRIHRKEAPGGSVVFIVDGVMIKKSVKKLDDHGRAHFRVESLKPGDHKIRAEYSGSGDFDPSSSPNLLHTVTKGAAAGKRPRTRKPRK